jgi:hypothetical protein
MAFPLYRRPLGETTMFASSRNSILAVVIVAVSTQLVFAIEIHIHLEDNDDNPMDWDPNGTLLENTFNAAAEIWENLLPGPGTFDVDVMWSDDIGSQFVGLWSESFLGNNTIEIHPTPNFNWFYDSTPLMHGEFDFTTQNRVSDGSGGWAYQGGQWLYRDIDSSEQSSWFNSNPPGALEVGYLGWARYSPTIQNQYDLLSTVLHELGHELGVNTVEGLPWEAQP